MIKHVSRQPDTNLSPELTGRGPDEGHLVLVLAAAVAHGIGVTLAPGVNTLHFNIAVLNRIKFLTKAVYDLLPTPANKNKWYGEDERCNLCNERGTLNHILSGCRTALSQGRYTWRHNKVLQELYERVREKANTSNAKTAQQSLFVMRIYSSTGRKETTTGNYTVLSVNRI